MAHEGRIKTPRPVKTGVVTGLMLRGLMIRDDFVRTLLFFAAVLFLGGCLGTWGPSVTTVPLSRSYPDGTRYEGESHQGIPHGEGSLTWPDGARYTGHFDHGQRTGIGTFQWPSGNRFEGTFKDGKRHGTGSFIWAHGARYTGTYRQGKKHGAGIFEQSGKTVEICRDAPMRREQRWRNGRLIHDKIALPDQPCARLTHTTGKQATPLRFRLRMSQRLSTRTPAPSPSPSPAGVVSISLPPLPASPRIWHDERTGMAFTQVPAGCFQMGSSDHESNEKPPHTVCLDTFWIGVHEVTQGTWQKEMGTLPPQSTFGTELPVDNISWHDVQHLLTKLNGTGKTRFRLPSEAEWEYACRSGGRRTLFCGGESINTVAWHKENSDNRVHPVGGRQANALGVHDMSGNVWEWVSDWYDPHYYRRSSTHNPSGPPTGRTKVFRGGSWGSAPKFSRATLRYDLAPDRSYHLLGLRLIATPPPPPFE